MAYLCREGEEQPAARKAQERREILVNEMYSGILANARSYYANNVHIHARKEQTAILFLKFLMQ